MFVPRTLKQIVPSALALSVATNSGAATPPTEPTTVVLVHGAFADSSSWNGVVPKLEAHGLRVVGAANPLRSVSGDAAYVGRLLDRISGPVVLVGHSYGGAVISQAATGRSNVKALVYVAAFVPDAGETALGLAWKFPGGTLNDALAEPVTLPGGGKELSIQAQKFHQQFAADVPATTASIMAATQRPIAEAALTEPSGPPAWKSIPAWTIYGTADKNIPPAAMSFMSKRANARRIVELPGASHAVMVSEPDAVAALIVEAAQSH
jgi:pimeloyl-ACP methyl ester carboxylesterase